jgi:ABC-type multidrug transport system fused ATPase/permease subunit
MQSTGAADQRAVFFYGEDIAGIDPLWLRRRVGMCFQRPTPFPGTVADNLRVADPDASVAVTTVVVALGLLRLVFTRDHRLLPLGRRPEGSKSRR